MKILMDVDSIVPELIVIFLYNHATETSIVYHTTLYLVLDTSIYWIFFVDFWPWDLKFGVFMQDLLQRHKGTIRGFALLSPLRFSVSEMSLSSITLQSSFEKPLQSPTTLQTEFFINSVQEAIASGEVQ